MFPLFQKKAMMLSLWEFKIYSLKKKKKKKIYSLRILLLEPVHTLIFDDFPPLY